MSPYKNPNRRRLCNAASVRRHRARKRSATLAEVKAAEPVDGRPLAAQVCEWVSGLEVSQGRRAGERFQLLEWQSEFIGAALADGVSEAGLSVARGNGKSALAAALAAAAVAGPLAQVRGEVVVVAASIPQGRILWEHAAAFLAPRIESDPGRWSVSEHSASIRDRQTGARVRILGSDPARAHGLAPALILADEPSQWERRKSDRMLAALRTALGKLEGGRLIALGTRPADSSHWFAQLLESPGRGQVSRVYAADPESDPADPEAWASANPSLDHLPDLRTAIEDEAERASRDSNEAASFRALRLNLGTADAPEALLLDADTWTDAESSDTVRAGPCVWGVDLGSGAAMSAVSAFYPETGRLECLAAFPSVPSLAERGIRDGVGNLYRDLETAGELIVTGGRVVDVAALIGEAWQRFGDPVAVASDRWRVKELCDALEVAGIPVGALAERGQGFKDGGEDVRAFRRAILSGAARPVPSRLLRSAMSEARVVSDPAGTAKLAKSGEGGKRARGRDDAAAASILAVAEGTRRAKSAATVRRLRYAVV